MIIAALCLCFGMNVTSIVPIPSQRIDRLVRAGDEIIAVYRFPVVRNGNTTIEKMSLATIKRFHSEKLFFSKLKVNHCGSYLGTTGDDRFVNIDSTEVSDVVNLTNRWPKDRLPYRLWASKGTLVGSVDSSSFLVRNHEFRWLPFWLEQEGVVAYDVQDSSVAALKYDFRVGVWKVLLSTQSKYAEFSITSKTKNQAEISGFSSLCFSSPRSLVVLVGPTDCGSNNHCLNIAKGAQSSRLHHISVLQLDLESGQSRNWFCMLVPFSLTAEPYPIVSQRVIWFSQDRTLCFANGDRLFQVTRL